MEPITINYLEKIVKLVFKVKSMVNKDWKDIANIISQVCNFDMFHFACYSEEDIDSINVEEYWDELIDSDKIFFRNFYAVIIRKIFHTILLTLQEIRRSALECEDKIFRSEKRKN